MKQFINIPAKVLVGHVQNISPSGFWPYASATDPYWEFGSSPKYYKWIINITINPQYHSSPFTRSPNVFNGMDIQIGMYVSDAISGTTVKIVKIISKNDSVIECEVEDVFRYNTFRDPQIAGIGIFSNDSDVIVYDLNEEGQPVIDPIFGISVGPSFYVNVNSRFQNLEQNYNFILEKNAHGFSVSDLIAVDSENNTFVKFTPDYPFLIGAVSDLDLGPNAFTIVPFQKIIDNYDYLPGNVGSVIYASDTSAGEYSLDGNRPVLIKLLNQSNSVSYGSVDNATTSIGNQFNLNKILITIDGITSQDVANTVNNSTTQTGVFAYTFIPNTVTESSSQPQAFLVTPASASINGVTVNFTTNISGSASIYTGYANLYDIKADIDAANINKLSTEVYFSDSGYRLRLMMSDNSDIIINNISNDVQGTPFAGPSSGTNIPLSTIGSNASRLAFEAIDARAIEISDVVGITSSDFGIISVENGKKAAAVVVEDGIRQSSTYVVPNISSRDALRVIAGDQAFVQDKGNGEWAQYVYVMSNNWVKLSDQDSAQTDAQSIELTISPNTASEEIMHIISNNRRVTFVTVSVIESFNAPATVSVGDDLNHSRLMTIDQNDLTVSGDYSTTPSYVYEFGTDVPIKLYFNSNGATVGSASIAITYT